MYTPIEAFQLLFARFFSFEGSSTRSEFWWFWIFMVLIQFAIDFGLNWAGNNTDILVSFPENEERLIFWIKLFRCAVFFAFLTLAVRRLHDRNLSGCWLFLILIPYIGQIALLIIFCLPSQHKTNEYGVDPTRNPRAHFRYYVEGQDDNYD